MPDTISDRHGLKVFLCDPDGTTLSTDQDAVDLIAQAIQHYADVVAIPVGRLDDRFFTLSTRVAGEFVQKFVNYRIRLAILGDIAQHLDDSSALHAFVAESNRGRSLWFLADLTQLDARLEREQQR
jgi:Domain of unknown function (DUF4180)